MNRKEFLCLSGTGLAALLLNELVYAGVGGFALLQLPVKLFVQLDDGLHPLVADGTDQWSYKNIQVQVKQVGRSLNVSATAPGSPLHSVILEWNYGTEPGAVLGDHWERSYGDLHFQPAVFSNKMPWYFIQSNGTTTTCFGVKTGAASICYWQVGDGKMQLTMDTRNGGNGVQLGQRILETASIIATETSGHENVFATGSRFCSMMCEKPLSPKQPVYGINDWYVTYGNNSADIILNHTARMAELVSDTNNRPFSVVDAGWATYSPLLPNDCCWQDDYSKPNDHFKDMGLLADNIKKNGMRPGLWTRPLCAKHNDKSNLLLPMISGRESAKNPVLDPSIEENIQRIKSNIVLYHDWGYALVKHDFTSYDLLGKWGNNMNADITTGAWSFNNISKTTAEIILDLYRALRSSAKDMYLLGCNTISHLSAGIFEINRIGDDTSGKDWERTRKMGVNTLGFRMIQHNNFYAADGDCVGLTNAVPWEKNKQWMQLLAESSAPLFISAQASATGHEQKEYIRQSFAVAAKRLPVAEPLDWLTKQWPEKWRLNGKAVQFNWD